MTQQLGAETIKHNKLHLTICPTQLCSTQDKKYQKKKLAEITNAIDGLFNSGGGYLILRYERSPPRGHVHGCIRKIEQKIQELLGTITLAYDIHIIDIPVCDKGQGEIKIIVKTTTNTSDIVTVNYNFCLPSNQQVIDIQPTENAEKLKAILMEKNVSVEPTKRNSHHKDFLENSSVSFSESNRIQFKRVKDKPEIKSTFATRLLTKSIGLVRYVSAFANFGGGHVYIGIDDNGIVRGELLDGKEKEKTKRVIQNAIKKMKWPEKSVPRDENEDKRWHVDFEPVKDSENNIIESLYVVVLFIAQCPGGVFTDTPDCYEITENNEVKKMDFTTWKKRFDSRLAEKGTRNAPSDIVYEKLTNLLNDNCDITSLDKANETAQTEYKDSEVKLICISKLVSYHLRRLEHSAAEKFLNDYEELLISTSGPTRFKVMEQYLHCVKERCNGNYSRSYEIAQNCLDDLNQLPPCLITAAFYIQIATLEQILGVKATTREEQLSLRGKAELNYDKAKRQLKIIHGFDSMKMEFRQKIYIGKALLYVGCSITGDMLPDSEEVIDIEKAKHYLGKSCSLSKFRKIQHLFAKASLCYRERKHSDPSQHTEHMKQAMQYSKEAEKFATECQFLEMQRYAQNYTKFFESVQQKICT